MTDNYIDDIRKRHTEVTTAYGDEPWDEHCIGDGEQAHIDRGMLLNTVRHLDAAILGLEAQLRISDMTIEALKDLASRANAHLAKALDGR